MTGFWDMPTARVELSECSTVVGRTGTGPAILLLHGYPETHVCWHRVAPLLAGRYEVVMPDLPGYGDSSITVGHGPAAADGQFSKRSMAAAMVELMTALGHDRFHVVGHDRGARVAYRLALDHPAAVLSLGVIDIMTTVDEWDAIDGPGSIATFHWPFLAQPHGLPEALLSADPDRWLNHLMADWTEDVNALHPAAVDEYRRCFRRPEVIAGTCADYRAGAGEDLVHDRADRDAGRRISAPVLAVASAGRGDLGPAWAPWATSLTSAVLRGGHFLPEENPDGLVGHLLPFLDRHSITDC